MPVEADALAEAADPLDEPPHVRGHRDPDRVGQDDLFAAEPLRERHHLALVHLALRRGSRTRREIVTVAGSVAAARIAST